MTHSDIRWQQRLHSFNDALTHLTQAIELQQQRPLSNLEKQGFVKAFEFTHELAWKVMKDYFIYQGMTNITGSRDATREAFQNHLITDGEHWMEMIKTRNKAVHTYEEATVNDVIKKSTDSYHPLYLEFQSTMKRLEQKENNSAYPSSNNSL